MQLPFNPIRLIIVCFSTLLIVGSITYFASDLNKKAQRLQSRQSQMGRVNPALQPSLPDMTSGDATSQTANSSQSPLPMTPGTPIPHQPQQPIPLQALSPTQENPDSSEADDDFENSLLPKNFIPWELKSVDELEHPELFKKPDDWQIFYLEDSGQTLRSFHENPNRYHGKFDLQTDLNVWASQLMLSLDLKFKNDLNKRKLSGNLRQQFGNSGISLSPNTTIMVQISWFKRKIISG